MVGLTVAPGVADSSVKLLNLKATGQAAVFGTCRTARMFLSFQEQLLTEFAITLVKPFTVSEINHHLQDERIDDDDDDDDDSYSKYLTSTEKYKSLNTENRTGTGDWGE